MFVISTVILSRSIVRISIRETHIPFFRSLCNSQVICLVETGTENIFPRVRADRAIFSHGSVPVIYIATIIFRTELCSCSTDAFYCLAIIKCTFPETSAFTFVTFCAACYGNTRTECCLHFRHIGNPVTTYCCVEINTYTATAFATFCCDHNYAIGSFRSIQSRC